MKTTIFIKQLAILLILATAATAHAQKYDPLAVDPSFHAKYVDISFSINSPNREIPLRIYLPTNTTPEPVIL